MRGRKSALAASFLLALLTGPVQAHHSFAAFDMAKSVSMLGSVKEFQWVNPHTWLIVAAPNDAGVVLEFRFEGVAPAILIRSGWTADTLLVGDKISVVYHPYRDGSAGGSYMAVTLPNGKRLGTSGSSFVPYVPPPNPRPEP